MQWRDWIKAGPPKCCHTCDHYSKDGHCFMLDARPPEEFAAAQDACGEWTEEVPF
jgi:hypothetical protein